ncbi:MAG TPA: tryptophan synthase subunit beta, partial [Spirochaetota bacterium]|nr:tryptophan synthase subunit beta [Spirochaetota bacterium]
YTSKRHFGEFGGRYVPEMLIPALDELEAVYNRMRNDSGFKQKLQDLFHNYSGRPTPLYFAQNLTRKLGGCRIFLKLEGLNHTGAHKINNTLGQILLAEAMQKKNIVAETGAGQHGLATATVCAKFGFNCRIFMGEVDIKRQYPNVYAMKLLGAEVIPVKDGTRTLKDAVNASLKYWIEHLDTTHYLLGSALGPYPYPVIVRDFQSVIGKEVKTQLGEYGVSRPDYLVACVGGGSNALGLFYPFLSGKNISFIGVEAGGKGEGPGENAVRFKPAAAAGIVQGYKSFFLQNEEGQVLPTHSVSAGLDYAGVGPELAWLYKQGKISFTKADDKQVLEAFKILAQTEGILPALESAHAVAYALQKAPQCKKKETMIINISGRGDKDIFITAPALDKANWTAFLKNEINNA